MGKNSSGFIWGALALVAVIAFFVLYPASGFDFMLEYIELLPSLVLVLASVYVIKESSKGAVLVGAFIMLGFSLAYMTGTLNTMGILIPDILTPSLPIEYLQLIIVIFSSIIGAISGR